MKFFIELNDVFGSLYILFCNNNLVLNKFSICIILIAIKSKGSRKFQEMQTEMN